MDSKEIYEELKKDKTICRKYSHAGVYCISITDKIVYIGKSRDMLCRLAQHIFYINNPELSKTHKYTVLNQAKRRGYEINFDVIYTSSLLDADDDIGWKEGQMIRFYNPPLNYQIPKKDDYHHFTTNPIAKFITLDQILLGGIK